MRYIKRRGFEDIDEMNYWLKRMDNIINESDIITVETIHGESYIRILYWSDIED